MDWIKVKTNHALYEYVDFSPTEFQAWIKIMALTAQLEHEPTREQMLRFVNHQTLSSLSAKLQQHSSDLSAILQKVLSDVSGVVHMKEYWKNKKKEKRALEQNVHMDIQKMSNDRLDKIREDKIRLNNIKKEKTVFSIPEWIKRETWEAFMEVRKKLQAPQTEHALLLIIKKLERLKKDGHSPEDVLNESISNGWKGVFPLKTGGGNGTRTRFTSGGPGISLPPEHKQEPAPDVSPEERKRNLERLAGLINGA